MKIIILLYILLATQCTRDDAGCKSLLGSVCESIIQWGTMQGGPLCDERELQ